jgi:endogenous inhibitor of DNA gyrase (YacG/DUF329 family)
VTKPTNAPTKAKCPHCGKPTDQAYRPFCSKRCADVDLGKWLNEQYILPGDSEIPDDIDET